MTKKRRLAIYKAAVNMISDETNLHGMCPALFFRTPFHLRNDQKFSCAAVVFLFPEFSLFNHGDHDTWWFPEPRPGFNLQRLQRLIVLDFCIAMCEYE